MTRRSSGLRFATSRAFSMLATVPPLKLPFILRTNSLTELQGRPKRSIACSCRNRQPRSDGIESKPQECTIRAPVSTARASWASIMRRIQCTSPLRSQ
jgi:hypothetical protein